MIQVTDLQFFLSAPQATAGGAMPGSAGNSLGNFISSTQLSATTMDNFFLDVTGAQNASLQVDYACLFLYNSNPVDTFLNAVVWMPNALMGNTNTATFAVGVDPTLPSPFYSSVAQAVAIQTPLQAPAGVNTWRAPTQTATGGLAIPNIPAHYCAAVWIQRTASGSGGLNSLTVEFTGQSLA